ncbi:efflux RND transporter periplasmic adaptor subunit [Bradyrhizobium sp. STM 3562]|uniref:efflux RND transporter periplasmic adaptor subunit n=1 Tax=Bradyrhizobium sp. STM 3562 TaxID=578924 RepID=UPI00388DF14A
MLVRPYWTAWACCATMLVAPAAWAQNPPAAPPAVGVVAATPRPMTETEQFLGRIEAVRHVDAVARVTAFLEKRLFTEGGEVKTGDKLYELEKGPFQADLAAKQAAVAQLQATLENAKLTTQRAEALLKGPAGLQSNYDAAIANQRSLEAQVQAAQAQVRASQINLGYTDITSPIDGKIGRTSVTEGNVVSPSSGVLTTIVSQDPMYVTFPVSVREALVLRDRYVPRGGFNAVVIRLQLPNGRMYGSTGHLNFANNTITTNTDTITLRGEIANPAIQEVKGSGTPVRELFDGEFVTVLLEGVQPIQVLAVPRAAVLSDQQGSYVFVVGNDNTAQQRRIQVGQSTATLAGVISGLQQGERVVVEGLQRVRAGAKVAPGPASAQVQALMEESAHGSSGGEGSTRDGRQGAAPGAGGGGTSTVGSATGAPQRGNDPAPPSGSGGR